MRCVRWLDEYAPNERENGGIGANAQRERGYDKRESPICGAGEERNECRLTWKFHSVRSATIGSTRVARRAGTQQAIKATSTSESTAVSTAPASIAPTL